VQVWSTYRSGVMSACELNTDSKAFFDDDYDDDDDDSTDDTNSQSAAANHCAQIVGYNDADKYWIVSWR
jgi:hypothetical protein